MKALFGFAMTAALAWTSCAPPYQPLLLCHNSNCTEPANPDEDDNLDSLAASLAVRRNGKPTLDGVEIDTFWAGDTETCLFTHDLPADGKERIAALVPARLIADHITTHATDEGGLTRQGGPFTVHIELKGHVGKTTAQRHSPEQEVSHARCALEVAQELRQAADTAGVDMEILFSSFDPKLLKALVGTPEWPSTRMLGERVHLRVAAIQGIPPPLDRQSVPIGQFGPEVDLVMAHPDWVHDGAWETYRSRNWEICFWMFSGTAESLDAIEHYRPKWVTTSENTLLVRWLER